jgi:hypothetical protein
MSIQTVDACRCANRRERTLFESSRKKPCPSIRCCPSTCGITPMPNCRQDDREQAEWPRSVHMDVALCHMMQNPGFYNHQALDVGEGDVRFICALHPSCSPSCLWAEQRSRSTSEHHDKFRRHNLHEIQSYIRQIRVANTSLIPLGSVRPIPALCRDQISRLKCNPSDCWSVRIHACIRRYRLSRGAR